MLVHVWRDLIFLVGIFQKGQLGLDGEQALLQIVVQDLGDAMPLLLLRPGQFGSQGADLLLRLDALGDICGDDGDPANIIRPKLINGKLDRHAFPLAACRQNSPRMPSCPACLKMASKALCSSGGIRS